MIAKQVRQAFLGFFARHGHEVVGSCSLVPPNDPTLLFTNAGMVQFKDVFTGRESRPYRRAASSQKCVRAGGKHNDLENVGFTARHHTFFEMLGNFSFGDYFKAEAIEWAYELLTRDLGLDPKRMIFTVYGGDAKLPGVGADDEARALWKKVAGVSDDRVLGLGAKDNFWQMGEVGPMGPCSEVHYHQGDDIPCPEKLCKGPACECDRWLEIWNLVFMQYERREKDGPLGKLPAPSVDTGAGLERCAAVVAGKRSNYETDLFTPLLDKAASIAGRPYGKDARDDASMRVIADHARATAFLIADGVFPDKTMREYTLRRIFRRAVRHGKRLGIEEPFLHAVCGAVVDLMGDAYPELAARRGVIEQVAREEESRFRRTLDRGLGLLENEFGRLASAKERVIPGDKVFQLYDTFGFPRDLTEVIAAERGFGVDGEGFERELQRAREKSEFKGQDAAIADVYKDVAARVGATRFTGYEVTRGKGRILAILVGGNETPLAPAGAEAAVVVDASPFYASSGGQIGDSGEIVGPRGRLAVGTCEKPAGDAFVHLGVCSGELAVGDEVELVVDEERRDRIRANHSATHLLHLALRTVLGEHAVQKGSLVAADRLRFDYSHGQPPSEADKERIEDLVNAAIRRNSDCATELLPIEEASRKGAMQMFGEKYGATVRVVHIGPESLEFCGGTHVRRTGDIGLCKIVSESGIAQGVRRVEAVTGAGALAYLRRVESDLGRAAESLRRAPAEVPAGVDKLLGDLKARDREISDLKRKLAGGGSRDLLAGVREIGGAKILVARTDVDDAKALREVGDGLRDRLGSGVLVLFGVSDRVSILAMVTKDLTARFHAGKLAQAAAEVVGGRGGGRPDMAQAGGSDPGKVDEAMAKVLALLGG